MQDDLSRLQGGSGAARPSSAAASVAESKMTATTAPETASKTFPLPPRNLEKPQRVVMTPTARGGRRWLIPLLIGIIVLAALGGIATWVLLAKPFSGGGQPVAAGDVLPATVDMVVGYVLSSAEERGALVSAWNKRGGQPSVSQLLDGDPRLLLNDPSVIQFYYVLLEGELRPYIVIPITDSTETLFAEAVGATVTEQSGWYVVHSLDTQPYLTALGQGTMATIPAESQFLTGVEADTGPIRLVVGRTVLNSWQATAAGSTFATTPVNRLALKGRIAGSTARFTGQITGAPAGTSPSGLLDTIPGDVTLALAGPSLAGDIERWQQVNSETVVQRLSQSPTKELLGLLTTPYVFYRRTGLDNTPDIGLVVQLPATTTLAIGSPQLEAALPAFLPFVTPQTPGSVAFQSATYSNVPLRYANVQGSNVALDYAIVDNKLLVATSKEGMFALIDTAQQRQASLPEGPWQAALGQPATLASAPSLFVSLLSHPSLDLVLPLAEGEALRLAGVVQAGQTPTLTMTALLPDASTSVPSPVGLSR
jgi:hypothetical protein